MSLDVDYPVLLLYISVPDPVADCSVIPRITIIRASRKVFVDRPSSPV